MRYSPHNFLKEKNKLDYRPSLETTIFVWDENEPLITSPLRRFRWISQGVSHLNTAACQLIDARNLKLTSLSSCGAHKQVDVWWPCGDCNLNPSPSHWISTFSARNESIPSSRVLAQGSNKKAYFNNASWFLGIKINLRSMRRWWNKPSISRSCQILSFASAVNRAVTCTTSSYAMIILAFI